MRVCTDSQGDFGNFRTGFVNIGAKNKKPRTGRGFLFDMARLGGFEPPTAWFVARYSIQLSYSRLKLGLR